MSDGAVTATGHDEQAVRPLHPIGRLLEKADVAADEPADLRNRDSRFKQGS